MKRRALFLLIFGVFLAVILGYLFITDADHSQTSNRPLPEFQPGIWDQPVIRPPYNATADLFSSPFMYQYDLDASSGFSAKYKKYYRPTFVLSPGKNATIVLNVTSYSHDTLNVTLAAIDDLPADGITYAQPKSLVLAPGTSGKLSLELSASANASLPKTPDMIAEGEVKLPVGLWLESEDWRIGQGFYLKLGS
jgi:hypothetical protein